MVKFSANSNTNVPVLGLGISEENVKRLKEGMPIYIKEEDVEKLLGLKCIVVIFYGKNEMEMKNLISEYTGPNTKIIGV